MFYFLKQPVTRLLYWIKIETMMLTRVRAFCLGVFVCLTFSSVCAAEQNAAIYWNSPEAIPLQKKLPENADFWRLIPHLTTQKTQSYCGVASAVTVLNTLGSCQNGDPIYYPYQYVTQDSFFTPTILPFLSPRLVMSRGVGMNELQLALEAHGAEVQVVNGDSVTVDQLRDIVARELVNCEHYVLVNYHRAYLQQKGGGHWSVLGAYDADSDRVLILDVARFSFLPVWVRVSTLLDAINSTDPRGITRGLLIVSGQSHAQQQPVSEDVSESVTPSNQL